MPTLLVDAGAYSLAIADRVSVSIIQSTGYVLMASPGGYNTIGAISVDAAPPRRVTLVAANGAYAVAGKAALFRIVRAKVRGKSGR